MDGGSTHEPPSLIIIVSRGSTNGMGGALTKVIIKCPKAENKLFFITLKVN